MIIKRNSGLIILSLGIISLIIFIYGFVKEVGIGQPLLFFLLTAALFLKLLKVLFEWYHYFALSGEDKNKSASSIKKSYSVDMLTTACPGEPFEMIEETLRAMVAVAYPHQNYLCDEGNDPALRALCKELGVIHVTRETHENAKAGNINNALSQAKGEICVIIDPDHVPYSDFLDHLLHHFDNPKVGYVQIVQAYKNQAETFVARAAAEQTYIFYGPYMEAMGKYGSAQAIGANCTFRREALDSIGGHAPGLTEDMHTSMLLHAKGWESVYVPKILSRGLVPTSLSAYYSQQLKWSRGTFDLWFNLFPRLFKDFNWKQRIHYGLMPIYYLFGIIAIIHITVPVYALLTGDYPWLLNPVAFFIYFIPFFIMSLFIRLYFQNHLHEVHEKGLHLFGGIMRVGTWWIYTIGFVYTIFNIKVPYIPTPKEHTSKNEFLLGLPNLLVSFICIAAAVYGLNQDWQPYSFLMAAFAISNGIIFLSAFVIGQSEWVFYLRNSWKKVKYHNLIVDLDISYHKFARTATPFIIICVLIFSSFLIPNPFKSDLENFLEIKEQSEIKKKIGGFYSGIYYPAVIEDHESEQILKTERDAKHDWQIVSTYLSWGDHPVPIQKWQSIIDQGKIPMITWEPYTNLFGEYRDHPQISNNQKVFHFILEGCFDQYVDQIALYFQKMDSPVFLRFAHEMENPMYPWSSAGGNNADEFKEAWKYIHNRFDALGVQRVSWIWSPWSVAGMEDYFPYGQENSTNQYVDWIGLTALNYAYASADQKSKKFKDIYLPFREKIDELSLELPVMLAEFGSTHYQEDAEQWNKNSLVEIKNEFPEIKSVVFFYSNLDKNWISDWRPDPSSSYIDWTFDLSKISETLNLFENPIIKYSVAKSIAQSKNKNIEGSYGNFTWILDGEPFYMKGICYNTGHDWHDGFFPLSRKQLEIDFQKIKELGANTIRRYDPGFYDRNILTVAEEFDLKVMYGFWFDPAIDYYKDKSAVKEYEKKVLQYVSKYKNQKNIIAWNIGNETYGLQKKYYAKPYLTLTRRAYLKFLENLAQKIHEIDPLRPVFSSEEHDHYRLLSVIHDFAKYAPSIDVMGINSYYEENISDLQNLFSKFDTLRPYAVTEFGPKGYWSHEFGDFWNDSLLLEASALSKGVWYEKQWKEYIEKNQGYNLGGFAFSWRDRYEGTATWFGITDFKSRLKPAYYYLQKAYKGKQLVHNQFPDISIVGHWHPVAEGETIWLAAGITNEYKGVLSYDWEVFEEKTWNRSMPIASSILDKQFVEIRTPSKKSNYRVYLHATDSLGNVMTASRPLLIK